MSTSQDAQAKKDSTKRGDQMVEQKTKRKRAAEGENSASPKAQRKNKRAKTSVTEDTSHPAETKLTHRILLSIGAEFVGPSQQGPYTLVQIRRFVFSGAPNVLSNKSRQQIAEAYKKDEDGEGEGDGEEDYELTVTAYVDLWLSVASLGDAEFEYDSVVAWHQDIDLLCVGGRSLFTPWLLPWTKA